MNRETSNENIKLTLESIFDIPTFDYNKFKEEINDSDLLGLEYLEKTMIRDFKDRLNDNIGNDYTYYDYIINLYHATRCLNECIFMHEQTKVKNNFESDIYFKTRDLLFKELGFNVEDIFR